MPRLFLVRSHVVFLAGLVWLVVPQSSWSAPPRKAAKPPDIKFETADKVELKGVFYPGGKNKPSVILVHKIGGNREQQGWDKLIDTLQTNDIAVLSFDLRGHGESTIVDPAFFWRDPINARYVRGARPNKTTISWKDFSKVYYPVMANDLVAAKRYLDQQNNAGSCNSSDVIVIGAEDGAALAAFWIATEWKRRPLVRNAFGLWVSDQAAQPEGQNIAGAVWLSIPDRFSGISPSRWFYMPLGRNPVKEKVPMAFVYGKGDRKAAAAADRLLMELKRVSNKRLPLNQLTNKKAENGKEAGAGLLGHQPPDTEKFISKFIEAAIDNKSASVWTQHPGATSPLLMIPSSIFQELGVYFR